MSANDLDFDDKGFGFGSQFSSPLSAKGSSPNASPETRGQAAVGVVVLEEAGGPGSAHAAAATNESVVDEQTLRPRTASGRSWRAMSNNYRYSFSSSRARDEHGHPLVVTKGIGSSVSLAGSVHSESTTEDPEESQSSAVPAENPASALPGSSAASERQPTPPPAPAQSHPTAAPAAAAAAPQAAPTAAEHQETVNLVSDSEMEAMPAEAEPAQQHSHDSDTQASTEETTTTTSTAATTAPSAALSAAEQGLGGHWDVIYDEEDFVPPAAEQAEQVMRLSVRAASPRQASPTAHSPRALSPAPPVSAAARQDRLSPAPLGGHRSPRPHSPAARSPVPLEPPAPRSPAVAIHREETSPPASPGPSACEPPSPVRLSPVPRSPLPRSPAPRSPAPASPAPLRATSPAVTASTDSVVAANPSGYGANEAEQASEIPAAVPASAAAASKPPTEDSTDAQHQHQQGIASRQLSSTSVDGVSPDRGASSRTSIDSTGLEERVVDADSPAVAAALRSRSKVSRSVAERVALLLPTAKSEPNVTEPGRHRLSLSDSIGSIQARLKQLHGPKTLAMKLSEAEAAAGEEHGGKLVVYTTTMRAIKATANACDGVRRMLQMHRVIFEERDVFMSAQFAEELSERCPGLRAPQVFFNGNHIGDHERLSQLNDDGELAKMLSSMKRIPKLETGTCAVCDGRGFYTCSWCGGDKQSMVSRMGGELIKLRCTCCNENGLMRCTNCAKPPP